MKGLLSSLRQTVQMYLDPALCVQDVLIEKSWLVVPDVKGREAILKVHAKNKPLAEKC